MTGNPIFGFLKTPPAQTGPHGTVSQMLRYLGILVIVGFVLSVLDSLLALAIPAAYLPGVPAPATMATAVLGLVLSIVIAGLVLFWINYAYHAWNRRESRGSTHALVLAILAVVFGALGVFGGLLSAPIFALFAGAPVLFLLVVGLQVLVSVGYVLCGAVILMNRNKALTGAATPQV